MCIQSVLLVGLDSARLLNVATLHVRNSKLSLSSLYQDR